MTGDAFGMAIFEQHATKLRGSAVSIDVALERGYVSADTKKQLERYGFGAAQRSVPALIIPLHGVTGELVGYQLRPDQPRALNGRVAKYETKTGQKMVLDVPPRCRPMLDDPTTPLIITEGPIKADALASAGLCAVALLGVWGWRATNDKGGKLALPDLEYVALNARTVYVAFDSDVMLNPKVHEAMARLAGLLEHRGAEIAYIYLPAGTHGTKVGVDDFLAAGHSTDELLALASPELRRPAPSPGEAPTLAPVEPVERERLDEILTDVETLVTRYVALPEPHHAVAVTLWAAHTHLIDVAESTPRLAALSPEPGSGKTRLQEVLEALCPHPLAAVNVTPAAVFRIIEKRRPTLLLDECDSYFGPYTAKSHEDLRALVNAGHRRGAEAWRCVGEGATMDVRPFPAFCAVALAGLGELPQTIMDRAIVLPMRRRRPDEPVEPWRAADARPGAHALRDLLAGWAATNGEELQGARPVMPEGVTDRPADVWEPLLAIAELAGGSWPARARAACAAIVAASSDRATGLGVRLLADIAAVFGEDDKLHTEMLLERLVALEESPWGDLRGKALDARGLARRLKPYDVRPSDQRVDGTVKKGYKRIDFDDPIARYIADPETSATSATSATAQVRPVADKSGVADTSATPNGSATRNMGSDLGRSGSSACSAQNGVANDTTTPQAYDATLLGGEPR